ncbi:MAG: hypothetical protein RL456_3002, partial [Pseudomonadota bacterium]
MILLRRIAVPILIAVASLGSAPAGEPSLATARSLLDAGKTDAAGAELLRLTKRRTDAENNYLLARVLMRTGDREAALQQLGQAIAAGFADEPRLGAEPDFAPLLEEKNFGVFLRVAKAEADRRKAYDAEEIPGLRTMRSPP